jgi:hypothetical protein
VKNIDLLAGNLHTVTGSECSNQKFEAKKSTFKKTVKSTPKKLYQIITHDILHHIDKIQNHDITDEILRYSKKIFF